MTLCITILFHATGGFTPFGSMMFTLNSDNDFTLTCISTGGPATTVTWTSDSTTTVTEGTETVLDDPETAQYTHTLTLRGREEGLYRCLVNNKVSTESSELTVTGIIAIKLSTSCSHSFSSSHQFPLLPLV